MGERVAVKRDRGRERERTQHKGESEYQFLLRHDHFGFPETQKKRNRDLASDMGKCWEFLGGSNSFPFLTFSHVRFLFFLWESVCLYQERTKPQTARGGREGKKGLRPNIPQLSPFSHIYQSEGQLCSYPCVRRRGNKRPWCMVGKIRSRI